MNIPLMTSIGSPEMVRSLTWARTQLKQTAYRLVKGKKDNQKTVQIVSLSGKDFKATPKISITDVFRELKGIMFK